MALVNPPPALRLPESLRQNQEARVYFEQIQRILFQLWARTGGGNDDINDLLNDQSALEGEVNEALGQIDNVARIASINALTADFKGNQALGQIAEVIQTLGINALAADGKANEALAVLKDVAQSLQIIALAPPILPVMPYEDVTPPITPPKRTRLGYFYDTTTQTAAAINTAYAITYNTTDITNGVYLGSPTSRIYVDEPGTYNFMFSAQLDNTAGGNHLAYIWARKNGSNIANSASQVRLKSTDGELVAAWNFLVPMAAGDYFELMWSVSDTAVQVVAQAAAAPVPAIPSVIMTVTNNL